MIRTTAKGKQALQKAKPLTEKQELSVEDILKSELKRIYSIEKEVAEYNYTFLKAAYGEDLQDFYIENLKSCKKRLDRLDQVFEKLHETPELIEEFSPLLASHKKTNEVLNNHKEGPLRDLLLIIKTQDAEHRQLAAYKAACELCEVLGYYKIGEILDRSLAEKDHCCRELAEILKHAGEEAHDQAETGELRSYSALQAQ